MNNKLKKKYKLKKINKIHTKYKYIFIFRYINIFNKKLIEIKKDLKKNNIKSLIINKNLIKKIKLQGGILILYTNKYNFNIIKKFIIYNNLEFLFLLNKNNIYSQNKINKLNINKKLNINIIIPYIFLLNLIKKIYKVNIA